MMVKNLNITAQNKCECESWLAHWERYSKKKATKCAVISCRNIAIVGGQVQLKTAHNYSWYIIPLCTECNNKRGSVLNINDTIHLISANVSEQKVNERWL